MEEFDTSFLDEKEEQEQEVREVKFGAGASKKRAGGGRKKKNEVSL